MISAVKAEGLETCATLGMLTRSQAEALKAAGLAVCANDHNAYAHTPARCYIEADREDIIADAERLLRELSRLPPRAGYVTETFCERSRYFHPKNGARIDAIAYIDAHADPADPMLPVIVLLDLRLPKVDGIDVLRHARRSTVWRQVPIIVLTTSRQDSDIGAAYQLGVNSYIVKPVEFEKFMEVSAQIDLYWTVVNRLGY